MLKKVDIIVPNKKLLNQLLLESEYKKFTYELIIKEFQKSKTFKTNEKLIDLLTLLSRNNKRKTICLAEFKENINKPNADPINCLNIFLMSLYLNNTNNTNNNNNNNSKQEENQLNQQQQQNKIVPHSSNNKLQNKKISATTTTTTNVTSKTSTSTTTTTTSAVAVSTSVLPIKLDNNNKITVDININTENVLELKEKIIQAATGGLSNRAKKNTIVRNDGGGGGGGGLRGVVVGAGHGECRDGVFIRKKLPNNNVINGNLLLQPIEKSIVYKFNGLWQTLGNAEDDNIPEMENGSGGAGDCEKLQKKPQFNNPNIAAIPIANQEQIIVNELLYCLTGIQGTYIKFQFINDLDYTNNNTNDGSNTSTTSFHSSIGNRIKFNISPQIHISLRDLLEQLLPLLTNVILIQRFLQDISTGQNCGQIIQSFAATINALLQDYYMSLLKLEEYKWNDSLNLLKLIYLIRPTMKVMDCLSETIFEIRKLDYLSGMCSGKLLTLLYDKITLLIGDRQLETLMIYITQETAKPYIQILELWIRKGIIIDPHQEFLVKDNEICINSEMRGTNETNNNNNRGPDPIDQNIDNHYSADYWEKRYTVRTERIPKFLDNYVDIILRTGKYLNVIRQCGGCHQRQYLNDEQIINGGGAAAAAAVGTGQHYEKLIFIPNHQTHLIAIKSAYQYASQTLLQVLLNDNDLMGHLRSIKRYFLLYQGDFLTLFMDASENELMKNVDKILPMKLENLLGLTLRLSSANNDPYKDDLHCQIFPFDLIKQISKIYSAGGAGGGAGGNNNNNNNRNIVKKSIPNNNRESLEDETDGNNNNNNNNEDDNDDDDDDEEAKLWQKDKINLTGLECFTFRYDVQWPISLVLNHFALCEYQIIFRQLFYCKHVERQLLNTWIDNTTNRFKLKCINDGPPTIATGKSTTTTATTKRTTIMNHHRKTINEEYRLAFIICHRMLQAIQNLQYYMMNDVIEPSWHEFIDKMNQVENIDDVLLVHQNFLNTCLDNCLLKNPNLVCAIIKLCNLCLDFCKFMHIKNNDEKPSGIIKHQQQHQQQQSEDDVKQQRFIVRIQMFDEEFQTQLVNLLKQINDLTFESASGKLNKLIHRINFNAFYNERLEVFSTSTTTQPINTLTQTESTAEKIPATKNTSSN